MYRVLYRKWRPQTFDDVSGQEHITTTLKNEVVAGRLNHAYLFTGSRGTGKTTCAKILAKAVNCLDILNGNPCGECEVCRGIDDGSILDVVEMDAASNRNIDDIRQIIDEVQFKPAKCKYRVYIIDEVHMLTSQAFNALLKTLEEPPEHVIFILATTEVHKLPQTILSRCQKFEFHRIPPRAIADRLLFVAQQEDVKLSDSAAMLIASVADGALRDGLSLLDRCIAISSDIDEEVVRNAAGLARKTYLYELAACVINKNTAKSLEIIDRLYGESKD
ncbi:MAG: DNA polymerase III subunit gamma/tau, partial [Ruminococcus sp.]